MDDPRPGDLFIFDNGPHLHAWICCRQDRWDGPAFGENPVLGWHKVASGTLPEIAAALDSPSVAALLEGNPTARLLCPSQANLESRP